LESRPPANCQSIKFPPAILLSLWPFSGSNPRIAAATDYMYPWDDSIAASLAPSVTGEDPPDDVLPAAYMRLSTDKMPDLERRLRLDASRARAVDELADIEIWDWIEENFRTTPRFHTSMYLTALPFAYLVPRLLALTGDLSAAQTAGARREGAFPMRGNRGRISRLSRCIRWSPNEWDWCGTIRMPAIAGTRTSGPIGSTS
jgi:hypothetical protein